MTNNMNSDKPLRNRRSIRLKGYDYSKSGAYFITICVKDKIHFFGKIENGKMVFNDAGIMIDKWWQKIPEKFPDIELGDYQIMPNHFHAIAINTGSGNAIVRADPGVRPNTQTPNNGIVRADPRVRPENESSDSILGQTHGSAPTNGANMGNILGEHAGSPVHRIVQWFKTMSTNEYIRGVKSLNWPPFDGKLWQRNYYEHIIRDEISYRTIANYIINNPNKWNEDKFNV
jgi:putative transposase